MQGDIERYYANQNVDVFFSESGQMQRHPAASLQPGWQVVGFVDGRYEGLFKRFAEAVKSRLPVQSRVALELWQVAKDELWNRYLNKNMLYHELCEKGLRSTYAALQTWFDEDGILAPLHFEEFEIVAKECETYRTAPAIRKKTFEAIQNVRGLNRLAGKALRSFLRAVVSGDGYEEALDGARKLDAALGDVLAAVEVLDVCSVRVVGRSN